MDNNPHEPSYYLNKPSELSVRIHILYVGLCSEDLWARLDYHRLQQTEEGRSIIKQLHELYPTTMPPLESIVLPEEFLHEAQVGEPLP